MSRQLKLGVNHRRLAVGGGGKFIVAECRNSLVTKYCPIEKQKQAWLPHLYYVYP